MKILFFDMEFANGKVPGSIYSIGYTVTDEYFRTLVEPTDLLINPDCEWNEYVEKNILAYPKEEVEAAPKFPEVFDGIRKLFTDADLAVGFAVENDTRALKKACERYGLEPFPYWYFDTEQLCRMQEEHKNAHGLAGYVRAWCGEDPDHQHRSDGDAYATMLLLRAVCSARHVDAEMMTESYPECMGEGLPPVKKQRGGQKKQFHRRRRRPHGGKNRGGAAGEPQKSRA